MSLVSKLVDKLDHTIDKAPLWMIPNFSTTTEKDRFVGQLAIMGSVKRFINFGYRVCCGIPGVTLHGNREDWVKLIEKLEKIRECGILANKHDLIDWCRILKPILEQFLASYDGKVDNDFWQDCIVPGRGYTNFDYINGWASAFSPFHEGKWRLNHPDYILETQQYGRLAFDDFTGGHSIEVPVKFRGSQTRQNIIFYAGGLLCRYDNDKNTIAPSFDVALLEVSDEVMKDKIQSHDKPNKNNSNHNKPRFMANELAEHFNLPKSINVDSHKHKLFIQQMFDRNICNLCKKRLFDYDGGITLEMQKPDYFDINCTRYKCQYPTCDIDVCIECSKKYT
jgi:hypothetical protein